MSELFWVFVVIVIFISLVLVCATLVAIFGKGKEGK